MEEQQHHSFQVCYFSHCAEPFQRKAGLIKLDHQYQAFLAKHAKDGIYPYFGERIKMNGQDCAYDDIFKFGKSDCLTVV